ncbi:glycosyltransferase [Sneathiella sp. P13V-1]|uniref:glycosyltransferase n=1 Tax=Sneathiella sp. P13V-1 TaxID=2697366 RepID=UPI00187B6E57|nr:glycosyltransferase [Sneathiella sp. P13V-1]MBE7638169.1 glycosyltransferase [Sneathiella sp. P13V-1]
MENDLKLMQAIGGAGHGGAENFFVNLTLAFERNQLSQKVVTRPNEVRDRLLAEGNVDVHHAKFGGMLDFSTKRTLQKIADDYQPDIFLSWMSRAASLTPKGPFPKVARMGGYYKLKYFQKCDHMVGITQHLCDYMVEQGWPADKVHYIPNFINWSPSPAISRAEFDTPNDVPLLLCLGRLHQVKGLDTAIRALAKVPDAHLWIAGDGPLKEELKKLSEDLSLTNRIRFLGWRTDKEALLATADIVVFPSRQEGFGNVILEAWASKTPMVATAAQGPAAYIKQGETGMIGEIDNVKELATNLTAVIESPALRQRIIENGHASYLQDFTESAALRNWKDFFLSIL